LDRSRVTELHNIAHFENVRSILEQGILCNRLVSKRPHRSIASEEVQAIRAGKKVPNGLPLHGYANLYFDARNSMLSAVRHLNRELAILRVDAAALSLPGVVVADRNAAGAARFYDVEEGIEALDEDAVYARWWADSYDAKQRRCAEVLVPRLLPAELVKGAYVMDDECAGRLREAIRPRELATAVSPDLFFSGGTAP
jgi:hypothetical protein